MDQREQFVRDCLARRFTFVDACSRFGISRKTGYKWLNRFLNNGREGLADQSRRPRTSPNATDQDVIDAVIALRKRHPKRGPKKLVKKLPAELERIRKKKGIQFTTKPKLPAPSTVAQILDRAGLVTEHPRRRRPAPEENGRRPDLVVPTEPNMVWTADFKGQFRTQDRRQCYPLTVMDRYSRYLLECHAMLSPNLDETMACFKALFRRCGLPDILRTDNGTPFCGTGLAGLSRLAVWWLRLGIRLERIRPGRPDENGSHERFHRTLKQETTRPPAKSCGTQQQRFRVFGYEYNYDLPHEALDQLTPAELYEPSGRSYPPRLPNVLYPGHFEVRRVSSGGMAHLRDERYFLSETLAGQDVGLEEIDDGLWTVHFVDVPIARINERTKQVEATHERRGDLSTPDPQA